ncbi:hypothetical protein FQN49_008934, partial [Arthroderma sp. PD_2]
MKSFFALTALALVAPTMGFKEYAISNIQSSINFAISTSGKYQDRLASEPGEAAYWAADRAKYSTYTLDLATTQLEDTTAQDEALCLQLNGALREYSLTSRDLAKDLTYPLVFCSEDIKENSEDIVKKLRKELAFFD